MRFAIFLFVYFSISLICSGQQSKYTAYTVNDGLPSNYVYRCIEDNKGFLWVATDAGIARFDGKHFQVFTTKDGLPDNEVLAVAKETNGRVWVNCFKQRPAYFDEVQNRFVNASEDKELAKVVEGTGIMYFFPLANGIMFYNEKGSFIYRDKRLYAYPVLARGDNFLIRENKDGSQLRIGRARSGGLTKPLWEKIYQLKDKKYIDSAAIKILPANDYVTLGCSEGKTYLFDGASAKCYIYSNFSTAPLRFKVDSVNTPEPFFPSFFLPAV